MTRLEAIEEEIKKLSPEELAELRGWLAESEKPPVPEGRKYTSEDIHRVLFPNGPPEYRSIEELRETVEEEIRQKYARR
jgi:hypothetical protein